MGGFIGFGGSGGEVGEGARVEGFPAVLLVLILRTGGMAYYSFVPSSLGGRWVGWSAIAEVLINVRMEGF